jgi:hypothetical protein
LQQPNRPATTTKQPEPAISAPKQSWELEMDENPPMSWQKNNFQSGDRQTRPIRNRKKIDSSQKNDFFTDFYPVKP